ncbi:4-hydroxybenzoate octaprenyltransferase [Thioalkalivibrio sp. HK1]|uniref:4-hydroxybenzoate octaprenyltransferase n=1 Tax=Thioalkalivibrio sp. HK1 TaxID=1469245 RepID=UPI00046EEBC2|nr:4-hydroxybenzoate octaprenyltransferase [Thioalkalivibrio sp. HK1]
MNHFHTKRSPRPWTKRIPIYLRLMRAHQPIGTLLLLWPTLWALWIAGDGHPQPTIVIIFVIGVFVMRSAGCVINDFADRRLDPHVERTRNRPLASGEIGSAEALALFTFLGLIALALVSMLNPLTWLYSIGGILLTASYPFMKRWTSLPQLYLGLAFAWGVPMAFAALTDEVPRLAWLIFTAVAIWAVAYDTIYAMVDRQDDLKIGIKSTAILCGQHDRAFIASCQITTIAILALVGQFEDFKGFYKAGLVATIALFSYQQWLIRNREPRACFRAFRNNHWAGAAIFTGIVAELGLG